MHGRMSGALGAIKARPTRENEIRSLQQRVFTLNELPWRVQEGRQFIHAIVNDSARLKVIDDGQRHWV
jgi:hypothetical protein